MQMQKQDNVGSLLPYLKYIVLALLLGLVTLAFSKTEAKAQTQALIIPAQSDWVDHGLIFTNGAEGEWDNILWGGFAGCVTKKDGQFYLYYQGSDGYDEVEGTVTNRKIGVATSSDGLTFQKYANNPVVTHAPNNGIEEGAVSCGVSLDGGNMTMYYGANTLTSPGSMYVNANGIAAESSDGYNFNDLGVALDWTDSSLWGNGDEIFPVMSLRSPETNQWIVYYIPNGVSQTRMLGVAWGNTRLNLSNSAGVTDPNGSNITTWGMGGGVVSLQDGTYAVFTNNVSTGVLEARVMDPNNPASFSNTVQSYSFSDFNSGVVYYDAASSTWYLYYRNSDASAYGVKTAVVNQPVNQAPSVSAGPDTTVTLQNGTAVANLSGSVSDDGLPDPPGATTASWSLVSGPASVSFNDASDPTTAVTMNTAGSYVLELTADDGDLVSSDSVTITVEEEQTGPVCRLVAAEWNRTEARNGHRVQLIAPAADCGPNEMVRFDIYEVLAGSQAPLLIESMTTTIGNNGQAKSAWKTINNCSSPGIECPAPGTLAKFYFEVYPVDNPSEVTTSGILTVTP